MLTQFLQAQRTGDDSKERAPAVDNHPPPWSGPWLYCSSPLDPLDQRVDSWQRSIAAGGGLVSACFDAAGCDDCATPAHACSLHFGRRHGLPKSSPQIFPKAPWRRSAHHRFVDAARAWRAGLVQSSKVGATPPSRIRPPAQAANHAAAAPRRAAAPAVKARMTAVFLARAMFSFARADTPSTRRSASAGASPVRVATRRLR